MTIFMVRYVDLNGDIKTARGIVVGNTFTEAVENLENYYGNDLDSIELLKFVVDADRKVIEFESEDLLDRLTEESF